MAHEIVLYRFRPDAPRTGIDAVMEQLDDFLRAAPGFVHRHTLHDPSTDTWIDVAEWRSMEEAMAAAQAFAISPGGTAFMSIAEPSSVQVLHAHSIRRLGAPSHVVGANS